MNRHAFIAFAASLGMGVAFLNLTPALPTLQAYYGVSYARLGLLVTAMVLTHSLVQIPSGLVVDKLGVRKGLILALGLGFLGCFLSIFSNRYSFLLALRLLTGLGTGLSFVAGLHYGTAHTPENQKIRVQAIFGGLINIGSVVPFFTSPLLLQYDGRLIHLLTALFFFLPLLAAWIWGQNPEKAAVVSKMQVSRVFTAGPAWTLGFSHALFFGGMMTIGTWITSYLLKTAPGPFWLPWLGWIGGLVIAVSAAGRFLGVWVPSWLSPRTLIIGALALLAVAYGGLGVSRTLPPGLVLLGVAALMSSVTFGSVFSLGYRYSPPQVAGTTIGLINFIASIGAFLFPIIFGYLLDLTGTFTAPFLFLSSLAFLTLLRVFTLPAEPG
ncbi:MAG: MFS transporter [Deltaproteobacteria bacterium]|nr:MFS transporter [Deltaproteobacteria bacterium]